MQKVATAKPLRIAFFMHDLSGGGVERMRLALIAELRQRGLEVCLVLGIKQGALLPLLPTDLSVFTLGTARTLSAVPKLARFLRAVRPDVLVSSLDHNNIAAILARRISGVAARLIICQHNALLGERQLGWKYKAVPWAYWLLQHEVDGIVAVSRGVANELSRVASIPQRKISVIYNPVIDERFYERAAGAPPHAWLVKKIVRSSFLLAASQLKRTCLPSWQPWNLLCVVPPRGLVLLGEGEDELKLRRFVQEARIAHAVTFVGFKANPLPWIRHADALISSSRYEGLGNAIVEALACGTQVIATDCPHGPAEVLLQGKLGKLVPVGDSTALAEAIVTYGRRNVDSSQLRARGACFTASACADAYLKLFENIVGQRRDVIQALGMNLSQLSTHEVVEAIVGLVPPEGVRLVVTPNLDHVRRLRDPEFAAAYASAAFVCPDGMPVLLYARLRGSKLRARVTGCDVFGQLIRHVGLRRHRLFVVVESTATAAAATRWAESLGLGDRMQIAVAPSGLDGDDLGQSVLARNIFTAAPTILVMTLGAPFSEVFVNRHRRALLPCWALCVGQAVRVELALIRRAPAIWQQFGVEWLWRLGHEPRRLLCRYAYGFGWFPVAVWRDLVQHGQRRGG